MPHEDDEARAKRARVDAIFKKITQAEWARLHKELVAYALTRAKSPAKAQDHAQEAIMRVLDARWEPWDPDRQPELKLFLQSIVNRLVSNERKTEKGHREIRMEADALGRIGDGNPTRRPDLDVAARDAAERSISELRTHLRGDAEGLELVDEFIAGRDTPEEQSEATGHEIQVIRNTRRRVFHHAEQVRRKLADEQNAALEAAPAAPPPVRVVKRRPKARVPRRPVAASRPKTENEEQQ